jgi:DNA polymerase I-like protein with 3'-5' exonuclease and polymerase domains/uracil-DNA glycosylase
MAQMTVRASGPKNAKIMIIGDFPHEQDLRRGEPFIGGGGFELTKMLTEAGIRRDDCYMTLVMKTRCYPNELHIIEKKKDQQPSHIYFQGKFITQRLYDACMELRDEIDRVKPNVICTVGDLALFAVTGVTSSYNYRSSIMDSVLTPGYKVIPTLRSDIIHTQYARRPWMVHDLKRVKKNSLTPGLFHRDYKLLIAADNSDQWFETMGNRINDLINNLDAGQEHGDFNMPLACDIETRGGHITCISFAWSATEGLCVQLCPTRNPEGFWTAEQEAHLVGLMVAVLSHPNVLLVGQNFNYDLQYIFRHWSILPSNVADTMLMQHSAFSTLPKNLGFLSSMYCEDHLYWKDDRTDWKEGEDGEDEMKYWEYCATDSCRTLAVYHVLKSVLKSLGLEKVNEFQQNLRARVLNAMIRGVRIDHQKRNELSMTLLKESEKRKHWMREVLGYEINTNSPKQMSDFFYRQMGIKPLRGKSGGLTTGKAALPIIGTREPILWPIIRKISELRSLGVFHSTFVLAGLDRDKRMRCTFNVAGTETYRFASSKNAFGTGMNMQNIPKGGDTGDLEDSLELPNIRELFIPDPGMTMFDIDLDSADARIVAWESDCQWLKKCFKEGKKPYVEIMKEYYQDESKNKKSPEYPMFKALCHGTHYMGTAEGIAPRIGLDIGVTKKIQDWYLTLNHEIRDWHEEIKKQVKGRRYVENAFGYRVYFFDKPEGNIFNQAVADVPQSSVACLINRIWDELEQQLPVERLQILLQVHDSLVGQFKTSEKEKMLASIGRIGNGIVVPYSDPLYIPMGIVSSEISWGACQ